MTKRLCVYCGSSTGNNPRYTQAATLFGHTMVEHGYGLVYGGASIGLMGTIADSVLAAGGEAYGVMPDTLADREIAHPGLTELIITSSMHERKFVMADMSDAFVALPGGLGTLDELFEIWTWAQLQYHDKPVGALNVEGYFDLLLAFLENASDAGFVRAQHQKMLIVENDADSLLDRMASYTPPTTDKLA